MNEMMKKTYFAPTAKTIDLCNETLIAASPGVSTGSGLGNEYDEEDVSYSNHRSIWDNTEWEW